MHLNTRLNRRLVFYHLHNHRLFSVPLTPTALVASRSVIRKRSYVAGVTLFFVGQAIHGGLVL